MSSILKSLVWKSHREAERQYFVKILLSGKISNFLYAYYLENQLEMYKSLENACENHKEYFSNIIDKLSRTHCIEKDILYLGQDTKHIPYMKTTTDYIKRIEKISNVPELLMAHVYTRHLGDLYGGQLIAKKTPGLNSLYQFDYPIDELKKLIYDKVTEDMSLEAAICFDFVTKTFIEIVEKCYEYNLEFFEKS